MPDRERLYKPATGMVILLALGVYLAGNSRVGLWDRDEPRYAQTSKQLLQSDPPDWVVPRLLDHVRTAKPIFIYWCEAAAMRVFGPTDFAARFPSALGITGVLLVVALAGWKFGDAERTFWTVFILATSALVIAAGKMCITDGVLLLWITVAQVCLLLLYAERGGIGAACLMWIAVGLAGLTKGPVVLGILLTTMTVLAIIDAIQAKRQQMPLATAFAWWQRTRPLLGLLILAAVCGPWLWMIWKREPSFLPTALGHDVFGRAAKALEGHRGPPGFYFLTLWGTYMPWSLLLPATIIVSFRKLCGPAERFALAAILGPWIMMECVATKMVHYVLPIFPPLAFLTADLIRDALHREHWELNLRPPTLPGFQRILRLLPMSIWTGAVVLLSLAGFAPFLSLGWNAPFPESRAALMTPSLWIAVMGIVLAGAVGLLWWFGRIGDAVLAMGVGMWALLLTVYLTYLPRADFLWLPQWAGEILRRDGAAHVGDSMMLDYQEDSLAWYQGGTIRAWPEKFDISRIDGWAKWTVLTREQWEKTPLNVRDQLEIIASKRGFKYADRLKVVDLLVVRKK